jgi:hypothetical protein
MTEEKRELNADPANAGTQSRNFKRKFKLRVLICVLASRKAGLRLIF